MALHKKRRPVHEINVVPYVDVMLVLLVIFMVTAPLVTPAIIDLPTVDKASAPRLVPLEVFVKSDQGIFVRQRDARGGVVNEQSLSRAQLPGFIKSLKNKGELSVVIGGDKNARYESVLHVMDELRKNGVQKVGLQVKTAQ
jgi:biopolymer transport protein TolR